MYHLQAYVVAFNSNDIATPAMLHDVISPSIEDAEHDYAIICAGYNITRQLDDTEMEAYTRGEFR